MNPPLPRHQAVLQTATQRVKHAGLLAAQRAVDALGLAALSALKVRERDDFLAAQFELNRRLSNFTLAFDDALDRRIAQELSPRRDGATAGGSRSGADTPWESLSLVGDHEVEATISADRFGLAIQHACEWELRELDAYVGSLLRLGRLDHERNPLRPEVLGKALVAAVDAVSDRPEVRKLLAGEIGRGLVSTMPRVYAEIVADLRSSGLQPVSLSFRSVDGPGNDLGRNTSGYDMQSRPGALGGGEQGAYGGQGPRADGRPAAPSAGRAGPAAGERGAPRDPHSGHGASGFGRSGHGSGTGTVDAQLVSLIRRLASLGGLGGDAGVSGASGSASVTGTPFRATADGPDTAGSGGSGAGGFALPNLIYAHRDELRQASSGTLDHMVIDVVGSLFEHILSDPKVPPQMARQIARLQLPVLRVALGDATFFSSRRHPVRRFVNRIASLACSFEDFSDGPGRHFLGLVRDLVQEIVAGDFDQMALYEHKLAALEAFNAAQAERDVAEQGADAASLLEGKEHALRVQQRYVRQLQAALGPVSLHDFLREFITQVWSQAIAEGVRRDGERGALAQRLKRAGRDLVMSVQPKSTPADRKDFLLQLPQLMKELNDGLALIAWPDAARKVFFGQLLPAHADSLKGPAMSQLDHNLMVKQLDAILGMPLPAATEPARGGELPVLTDAVDAVRFSAEEADRIGLVNETAVDWDGSVDIEVGEEPELTAVDIHIDGLPAAEPDGPASGASLADHVQLGFAYRMHLEGQWQKVKLSYVSPGRAFFVFTRGRKHPKSLSMTLRMLRRLCETGRMRAYENALLLERATARARKQLAAMKHDAPAPLRH